MKLREHLDSIAGQLESIRAIQAGMAKDIEHHILRTDLLEERQNSLDRKIAPLFKIYHFLQVSGSLLLLCSGVLALLGIVKFLFK